MTHDILYFVDEKGNAPVREYIVHLPFQERVKVFAYLKHLSEIGYQMRRPFSDYLGGKTGIYELRPGRHRVLYFFIQKGKIILLHAFLKRTDQIPEREIEIALARKEICEVLLKYDRVNFGE